METKRGRRGKEKEEREEDTRGEYGRGCQSDVEGQESAIRGWIGGYAHFGKNLAGWMVLSGRIELAIHDKLCRRPIMGTSVKI